MDLRRGQGKPLDPLAALISRFGGSGGEVKRADLQKLVGPFYPLNFSESKTGS